MYSPLTIHSNRIQQNAFSINQYATQSKTTQNNTVSTKSQKKEERIERSESVQIVSSGDRVDLSQESLNRQSVEQVDIETLDDLTGKKYSREQLQRAVSQAGQLSEIHQTSSASQSAANQSGGIQSSAESDVQSYLAMIRSFSKDEKTFNEFLDRMDTFLEGQSQSGSSGATLTQEFAQVREAVNSETITVELRQEAASIAQQSASQNQAVAVQAMAVQQQVRRSDPLVLDLDGDGIEVTSVEDGVAFDLTGEGIERQSAFVTGGDAFLALDRDGNGTIDDGRELFGDQNGAWDGIEELRKYDDNQDDRIDPFDSIYNRLLLFADKNRDGLSQTNKLRTLSAEGIRSISLRKKESNLTIAGNLMTATTEYKRNDGSSGLAGDLLLNYLA